MWAIRPLKLLWCVSEGGMLWIWHGGVQGHALKVPMHACQVSAEADRSTVIPTARYTDERLDDHGMFATGSRGPNVRPTTNRALAKMPQVSTLLSRCPSI
jgi:hypothetical protein